MYERLLALRGRETKVFNCHVRDEEIKGWDSLGRTSNGTCVVALRVACVSGVEAISFMDTSTVVETVDGTVHWAVAGSSDLVWFHVTLIA